MEARRLIIVVIDLQLVCPLVCHLRALFQLPRQKSQSLLRRGRHRHYLCEPRHLFQTALLCRRRLTLLRNCRDDPLLVYQVDRHPLLSLLV